MNKNVLTEHPSLTISVLTIVLIVTLLASIYNVRSLDRSIQLLNNQSQELNQTISQLENKSMIAYQSGALEMASQIIQTGQIPTRITNGSIDTSTLPELCYYLDLQKGGNK